MRNLFRIAAAALAILSYPLVSAAGKLPEFQDFPAPAYKGTQKSVLLTDPKLKELSYLLRRVDNDPVDFAGEYSLVAWTCGTTCLQIAAVSKRTGAVRLFPRELIRDDEPVRPHPELEYRVNSRLIKVLGEIDGISDEFGQHFYELTPSGFKRVAYLSVERRGTEFDLFPAALFEGPFKAVTLATSQEKNYRTRIRAASLGSVNFGGEYVFTGWGCGTSCLMFVAVSKRTGKAFFLPGHLIRGEPENPEREVNYRRRSTLLTIVGTLGDEEESIGFGRHYFQITPSGFKRIRSVPLSKKSGW